MLEGPERPMSLLFGALYRGCDADEVHAAWRRRLLREEDSMLALEVDADAGGLVRVRLRPRRGRSVPHRQLGALVRAALGPEREEQAEFWLLEPAEAPPGALRLRGADWRECLESVSVRSARQVRLWSPMVCPAGIRGELQQRGRRLGLALREADCWAVVAVPRRKPEPPPYPAPWKGNYGW
jgi:hypothetical protein